MAAEDYIDEWMFPERMFKKIERTHMPRANTSAKRNRDIEWITGQGEILRLEDMKDSHLLNTVAYIQRRVAEYQTVADVAHKRNMHVPPFAINKKPADFWIDAMLKELNRRQMKAVKEAQQLIANS